MHYLKEKARWIAPGGLGLNWLPVFPGCHRNLSVTRIKG
jgi:hypothetical protein